jgi:transaldolase
MTRLAQLRTGIYLDTADQHCIRAMHSVSLISGFTTNPTLMRRAGVRDFRSFAREILQAVEGKPVSFEVIADDCCEMHLQATAISQWGENVFVKVPAVTSRNEPTTELIRELAGAGIKVNVTALFLPSQVEKIALALAPDVPAVVSVFAGRIADTGIDPMPIMRACKEHLCRLPRAQLLWASVREVFNIYQAEECGCDIVTVPADILNRAIAFADRELSELSVESAGEFTRDAADGGLTL